MRNAVIFALLLSIPLITKGQATREFNIGGGIATPMQEFSEKNTNEAGLALNGWQYHAGMSWLKKRLGFRLQYQGGFFPVDAQFMADQFANEFHDINWHVSSTSWIMNGLSAGAVFHSTFGDKVRVQAIVSEGFFLFKSPESTTTGTPDNPYTPSIEFTMYSKTAGGLGLAAELRAGYTINETIAVDLGGNYFLGKAKFEQVPVSSGEPGNFEQRFAYGGVTISFVKKF